MPNPAHKLDCKCLQRNNMQIRNFEAYIPTNSETWIKLFALVLDGTIAYQTFYTMDDHNQKG